MSTFFNTRSTHNTLASASSLVSTDFQPWIEKYRPKSINDVSAQEQVVAVLKKSLESHNLPHLLFYGPPGTGKTSTILALARELYGPELMKSRVLELNASDERGIQVVREKVKNFARIAVGQGVPGYPCPPYKIIILDEADSMTSDAQSALRRTMETYSKITRFCLICNYVSRIIDPLASRCAKFRFKPLDVQNTTERLKTVCDLEGIQISSSAIDTLITSSEGDLRKAIMFLQSASRLHKGVDVSAESVQEIAGVIPNQVIDKLINTWQTNDFVTISKVVKDIIAAGFSAAQILSQIHDRIAKDELLTTRQKAKISMVLGEVDKCLIDGADEHLQILNAMIQIGKISVRRES